MIQKIKDIFTSSIQVKEAFINDESKIELINEVTTIIVKAFQDGNKVLFCGNGGSASDAQHLAAEFSGRFYTDRNPLPSEALHCNTSYLTAVGNDYGFEFVYSRLIKGVGRPGDVLIALSTSGNSKNIINAINEANNLGIHTVGFTGLTGGEMKDICKKIICVPSMDTPRIQECHIVIGHIICQLVEEQLFGSE